ncbi:MAG: T9SS type A sorting domain-containing protein [Saprospiraceae bacterium]
MKSIIVVLFLTYCFVGYGQIINFPDPNFKNALVNTKCVDTNGDGVGDEDADINNDGEIDESEALKVFNLKIFGFSITDINGLSYFKSLENLICTGTQISTIGVNELKNLKLLDCSYNQIASLSIVNLPKLNYVNCFGNKIKTFETFNLPLLEGIFCPLNQIESIDITTLPKLFSLDINGGNKDLKYILAKNGNKDLRIDFPYNSKLSYVCADEFNIDKFNYYLEFNGIKNCIVNSYCSFTPGGKFFVLNGKNLYDINNNGCDEKDIKFQNLKYSITNTNNNITKTLISNSTGCYEVTFLEGTYTMKPILENPMLFETTPFYFTFPSNTDTIIHDFCITPRGVISKTNITVIPLSPPARPGFDASFKIVWENVGNQIESGTLNFTYDEQLLDYISATQTADQVADGIVIWNFSNLLPFEKREITVSLKVNRPTDVPAVNAGDKLYLTASILDNIFTLENTVVGSYDPNDKTCLQGDRVHPNMIGKYVDYLIRFENTGSYAAENIVVKDIIDTTKYDISSLQITDASHEVYTRIEGNKVEFIFENIQLPFEDANNDGYIAFKIKTLPTLSLGDSLKNLADIYFDYNFPIRTNEAQTAIALPVATNDITTDVKVYPNPVKDILYFDTDQAWSKAEIYDLSGRIIRALSLSTSSIDVGGLENGTYFLKLKHGDKVGMVKFVKL